MPGRADITGAAEYRFGGPLAIPQEIYGVGVAQVLGSRTALTTSRTASITRSGWS